MGSIFIKNKENTKVENKIPVPSRKSTGYKNLQEKLRQLRNENELSEDFVMVEESV